MPKLCYIPKSFHSGSKTIIDQANKIIEEYAASGYDLTLRQLYYQFVARDLLANDTKNYKRLQSIINDARLAGLIDWERIEDRTRGVESVSVWRDPAHIIASSASYYQIDLWKGQACRIEVWIEKEALAGVFQRVCEELRLAYLSCRGYTSASEMWRAGNRLKRYKTNGQRPVILHFGDHDPSGMDMSRDIQSRLEMFIGSGITFERLALNMEQVEEYAPPPNPAKETDVRFANYEAEYGDESWELDALNPDILSGLVRKYVNSVLDKNKWAAQVKEEKEGKRLLGVVSEDWEHLTEGL